MPHHGFWCLLLNFHAVSMELVWVLNATHAAHAAHGFTLLSMAFPMAAHSNPLLLIAMPMAFHENGRILTAITIASHGNPWKLVAANGNHGDSQGHHKDIPWPFPWSPMTSHTDPQGSPWQRTVISWIATQRYGNFTGGAYHGSPGNPSLSPGISMGSHVSPWLPTTHGVPWESSRHSIATPVNPSVNPWYSMVAHGQSRGFRGQAMSSPMANHGNEYQFPRQPSLVHDKSGHSIGKLTATPGDRHEALNNTRINFWNAWVAMGEPIGGNAWVCVGEPVGGMPN